MEDIPEVRRRGRPAAAQKTHEQQETAPVEGGAPPKRRRRSTVGGHALKLGAPLRAGYTRRWVNDAENRIAELTDLAYDFVNDRGIQTSDPSSRVSRIVGTKATGEPLRAYLMETPDELYAEGVADKEAHNAQIDDAIRDGRDSTGQMSAYQSETYGQGSIKSDR